MKKHASSFRALALIGVAASLFCAAFTTPCVAGKPAEVDPPVACPPQWLPALLAGSEFCHGHGTDKVCVRGPSPTPVTCTPHWVVGHLQLYSATATMSPVIVTLDGVQIAPGAGASWKTTSCDEFAAIGVADGIVRGTGFRVDAGFSASIIGEPGELIEFRYWNAAEGKEYFSGFRYTMENGGKLGSYGTGAFELVLRETSYCPACLSCTSWLFTRVQPPFRVPAIPLSGDECVEVDGVCQITNSVVGPSSTWPCVNNVGVDCTATCLPSPSQSPPLHSPSLLSPSPPPPSPSPPPTLPPPPPPTLSPMPLAMTVPHSPPSSPLAPFADELCTYPSHEARCKVTLKIEARLSFSP